MIEKYKYSIIVLWKPVKGWKAGFFGVKVKNVNHCCRTKSWYEITSPMLQVKFLVIEFLLVLSDQFIGIACALASFLDILRDVKNIKSYKSKKQNKKHLTCTIFF